MKKIKFSNLFQWFNMIDHAIWKDRISVSGWLASSLLLMAALCGALSGGTAFVNNVLEADIEVPTIVQSIEIILYIWAILSAESIAGGSSIVVMITRSLLMLAAVPVCFFGGYLLSVVVLGIITLIAFIYALIFVLKVFMGVAFGDNSSKGKRKWKTADGETITESGSGLLGETYAKDSDGNEYEISGNSARRR